MKTTVSKEQHICDFCHKAEAYAFNACQRCGKDICYNCTERHAKEYSHGVYVSGSGDGRYCNECDDLLTRSGTDALHNAYRAIKALRNELEAWSTDFKKRMEAAESTLKKLQK